MLPMEERGPEDASVARFEHRRSILDRAQGVLHTNPAAIPLIILVITILCFGAVTGGRFFSTFTLTLILQQVAIVGIVAAAQSLVILAKGIDLSVGAMMVLSSVIVGGCVFRYGFPTPLALLVGFGVGALCGFINGLLVARLKLPPFIVTLGTWQIFLAANFIYSRNETIRSAAIAEEAPLLQFFGRSVQIGGAVLTYGVIAMLILIAVLWYVLNHTAWGRHVYATGDDVEAAELSGVRASRMLIQIYTISGIICAFAGWVLIGRLGAITPTAGQFTNVEAITAVVIGGTSLFGGRGSILGTIFGALTVGCFSLGLRLVGADPQWTFLLIGTLTIVAVALDQWIRKVGG